MTVRFAYRAADARGRETRGDLTARDAGEAVRTLRARALWAIELEPLDGPADSGGGDGGPVDGGPVDGLSGTRTPGANARGGGAVRLRVRLRVRCADWWARLSGRDDEALAVITRSIATLLDAGVPVDRALDFAARRDDEAGAVGRRWRATFAEIGRHVRGGAALGEAIAREGSLPAIFAPSVSAAEAAGTLPDTAGGLAAHLERRAEVQARIRTALVYPSVLAASSIIGTLVILLVVVPRFAMLVSDAGTVLPASTRLLVGTSALLARGGWLVALTVAGLVAWWRRALRAPERRLAWDARRLGWPVLGVFERQRDSARYLGTLALAVGAGVGLLRAMALARATVQNGALAARLEPAELRVRDGASLSAALGAELPPLARQLLDAGEAGGALAALARRAGEAADAEAERTLTRLVSLVEPALILGFGGVVAFVALALLQAIYGVDTAML